MRNKQGPLLVMFAASLWALDSLLRTQLTFTIPPAAIVLFEHLVGFVLLSPFLINGRNQIKSLKRRDWIILLLMTITSSVAGTLLFTQALALSFATGDFATPILLQKLQPLFVITLSAILLKEKLSLRFLMLVPVALIGSYLISFGADPIPLNLQGKESVYILSIAAALAWGAGTIMSKYTLTKLDFKTATSLRFLLAIPVSFVAMMALNQGYKLTDLNGDQIIRFVIIALTTGAVALLIYYRGLKNTPAKVATIAELTFPIVTILIAISSLNPYGAPQVLSLANIFGIILLLLAITNISFDKTELDKR